MEEIIKNNSERMLKDCLFFINSIGKQDEFLNYIPKTDKEIYLSIWD
jgi:hypothetical protein